MIRGRWQKGLKLPSFVPRGFLRDDGRRRDRFATRWESRWGAEALRLRHRIRVTGTVGTLVNFCAVAAFLVTAANQLWPAVYILCALTFLVTIPLMLYAVVLSLRVTRLIKARYGLAGVKTTPLTKWAMNDERLFDEWVAANRREAPRVPLDGNPPSPS